MNSKKKGHNFEREVEQLLTLRGYVVRHNELISGTQIDLVAFREDDLDNVCFVVECADREEPIGVPLLKEKASALLSLTDARYVFRLLFISRNGFTAEAKAFAHASAQIMLLRPDELEARLVNFQPYVNWYLTNYEGSVGIFREGNLSSGYVELACRDSSDHVSPSLTNRAIEWLEDEQDNLLFLLGEYGSGKTSFTRHLVYRLLDEKYRRRLPQHVTPILINLREYRSATNIQQVVTDTLVNLYGVSVPSFLAFERICSSGRVALFLDGFDEMAVRSDPQTVFDCFQQIFLLAGLNAKILLTCRSNYFRDNQQVLDALSRFNISVPYSDQDGQRIVEVNFRGHGTILHVERLTQAQIREFVERRFGQRTDEILAMISRIHDLSDLSTRPVLLDMILTTLPDLSKSAKPVNSAALYQHYTDRWKARDEWRVSMELDVRQLFSEALAWAMHSATVEELAYQDLEAVLDDVWPASGRENEATEQLKNDIQTCSFLVRTGSTDAFRFAHKSFLEFFVARKLAVDLMGGNAPDLKPPRRRQAMTTLFDSGLVARSLDDLANWAGGMSGRLGRYRTLTMLMDYSPRMTFTELFSDRNVVFYESTQAAGMQTRIERVFEQRRIAAKSRELGLSEEIATFVLEILENTSAPLAPFIDEGRADEVLDVVADVFRLSRATEYVRRHQETLRGKILEGGNPRTCAAFAAALTRAAVDIDVNFVIEARAKLGADAWSYFLFELASAEAGRYRSVVEHCSGLPDLSLLDRAVCYQSLRGGLPKEEEQLIGVDLVRDLLQASSTRDVRLGLELFGTVRGHKGDWREWLLSLMKRVREGLVQPLDDHLESEVRNTLLTFVRATGDWKTLRLLWASEKDPDMRKIFAQVEQELRNAASREKVSLSWKAARANREVRNELWKSLRPH